MRIDEWYRGGNIAPEPELSAWRLDPERHLRDLRESLLNEDWRPSEWLQLPYPKKGKRLRHFVWPTVKDQVAFMVHMTLLAPIIDNRLQNFVFGNRWYRPVLWKRPEKKWHPLPYPLLTRRAYLPYAREHGMYRRVASWTVSRMTGAPTEEIDHKGGVRPEDYDEKFLPEWVRRAWWTPNPDSCDRAYWAALDLELAYPSVRLSYLRRCLSDVLDPPVKVDLFNGYPDCAIDAVSDDSARAVLADQLGAALQAVRIRTGSIPDASWKPAHARPQLFPEKDDVGIPTGLAVSGILLNVVLFPSDCGIKHYLNRTRGGDRGAILRFADDMYVFSRSPRGVLALMEVVAREVARPRDVPWLPKESPDESNRHLGLLSSRADVKMASESNLYVNLEKIRPTVVKEIVDEVRKAEGWRKCPKCEVLQQSGTPLKTASVDGWWRRFGNRPEYATMWKEWERLSVAPASVGPFVTALVERMSEIGWGGLRERFGEGAWDRLGRLEELARFDIDDEQVRPDTRRSFAVNRLVNAWLPDDDAKAREGLEKMRNAAEQVLSSTPWKFSLWTAVVRAAARVLHDKTDSRPHGKRRRGQEGGAWLEKQLRLIARPSVDEDLWAAPWPENVHDQHDRGPGWTDLYLSFHRASFWQGVRNALQALWAHRGRVERAAFGDVSRPGAPPDSWCYRAIPEGRHGDAIELLGDTGRWIRVLYGDGDEGARLAERPWELDQLVAAVLAAVPRSDAAEAWSRCASPSNLLCVPFDLPRLGVQTERLLQVTGRLRPRLTRAVPLGRGALEHLTLSGRDPRLGETLYPGGRPYVQNWKSDRAGIVRMGQELGCGSNIDAETMALPWGTPEGVAREVISDPFHLRDYGAVRRTILGSKFPEVKATSTLHRLLWSIPTAEPELRRWRLRPWETPHVGLPVRVAILLFLNVNGFPAEWRAADGPLTWSFSDGDRVLTTGRQLQFEPDTEDRADEVSKAAESGNSGLVTVRRSRKWDVPPHGAYFLPFLHGDAERIHGDDYALFCDVLLFLTALDGGERILDDLERSGVGVFPFEERWAWRSRIHLNSDSWKAVESVIRWAARPLRASEPSGQDLSDALRMALSRPVDDVSERITVDHFTAERVDLHVNSGDSLEIVRTVRRGDQEITALPAELRLSGALSTRDLGVRIAQVILDISDRAANSLQLSAIARNRTMEQVFGAFQMPSYGQTRRKDGESLAPDLVVFPELTAPEEEIRAIRECVEDTGLAALTGLYWKVLPPVYPASGGTVTSEHWIVNEAELDIPVGIGDRGPTSVRWYRVRKPLPSHLEIGRGKALERRLGGRWRMLPGRRWYRLIHTRWGDFSVAVCSDLIDAEPWRTLRGEILHLFVVACNQDVDLYDALTWARAYENYANLVAVNSGEHGGSIAWTPKRTQYSRELARFHGRGISVVADVRLPVRALLTAQLRGVDGAVRRAAAAWDRSKRTEVEFKSPPPGFKRRAVRTRDGSKKEPPDR